MKHHAIKSTLLLLFVLSLVACKKDPVETPEQAPPQQQLPNPLPAYALVSQKKWSETDRQTLTYNAKGQLTQLRTQWQFVEGDPTQIQTINYDYQYDDQDRPVQINITTGDVVKFFYHGQLVHRSRELNALGETAKEVTYIYSGNRIVQETWRIPGIPGAPDDVYKHVFGYDNLGNLIKIEVFEQTGIDQFKLLETTEYSDFDGKINPLSWQLRYPYLPQIRYQFHNPRKEVRQPVNGPTEITTHAYTYNAQGLPSQRRTTLSTGFVLTENYQY